MPDYYSATLADIEQFEAYANGLRLKLNEGLKPVSKATLAKWHYHHDIDRLYVEYSTFRDSGPDYTALVIGEYVPRRSFENSAGRCAELGETVKTIERQILHSREYLAIDGVKSYFRADLGVTPWELTRWDGTKEIVMGCYVQQVGDVPHKHRGESQYWHVFYITEDGEFEWFFRGTNGEEMTRLRHDDINRHDFVKSEVLMVRPGY